MASGGCLALAFPAAIHLHVARFDSVVLMAKRSNAHPPHAAPHLAVGDIFLQPWGCLVGDARHRYQQSHVVHPKHAAGDRAGKGAAEANYAREVRRAADKYDLDYGYLMSLLMLECGGRKPSGARFEPHVFKRLKQVRDGKRSQYEHVTPGHLADASDEALKNLATSWGPFQLMGYKCILLDVKIQDIRGPEGIDHGANWINRTYGDVVRRGRFRDCFHMHNAGTPYPATGLPKPTTPNTSLAAWP